MGELPFVVDKKMPMQEERLNPYSKNGLEKVVNGKWVISPSADWEAKGVSIVPSVFQPEFLVCARGSDGKGGVAAPVVKRLAAQGAAAILCDDANQYLNFGVPVLEVKAIRPALLEMGRAARQLFSGRVIGVTGSAGKTTVVAMLAHLLRHYGLVGQTQLSANLPVGIAWNLFNMSPVALAWVVEMAIGQMKVNAQLVQPHVALVTNVAPAHLEFHSDIKTIAEKKALIMECMSSDNTLVLYGEIECKDIFLQKAREKGVSVITYGEEKGNDVRLLDLRGSWVQLSFMGRFYEFDIGLSDKHFVLNALGVFAALYVLGFGSFENWKGLLKDFKSLKGRGEITVFNYKGGEITIRDESYNANPLSMQAAILALTQIKKHEKAFLILGDMKELGSDELQYHQDLKSSILQLAPGKLILCGALMKSLWDDLKENEALSTTRKAWYASSQEVIDDISNWLEPGDHIMLKASNSVGFGKVVDSIQNTLS